MTRNEKNILSLGEKSFKKFKKFKKALKIESQIVDFEVDLLGTRPVRGGFGADDGHFV